MINLQIVALTLLSVAADAMEEERVMSPARLAQSAAGLASFFATAVPLVHATSGAPLFETAVLMASSTWFLLLLGACLVWDYEPAAAGFVVNVFGVPFAARHVLFPRLLVLCEPIMRRKAIECCEAMRQFGWTCKGQPHSPLHSGIRFSHEAPDGSSS
eukprot:gene22175-34035_t